MNSERFWSRGGERVSERASPQQANKANPQKGCQRDRPLCLSPSLRLWPRALQKHWQRSMLPLAASHSAWPAAFPRERWPDPVSFLESWRKAAKNQQSCFSAVRPSSQTRRMRVLPVTLWHDVSLCIVLLFHGWHFSQISVTSSIALFYAEKRGNESFCLNKAYYNTLVSFFTQVLTLPGLEKTQCVDLHHCHHPYQPQLEI